MLHEKVFRKRLSNCSPNTWCYSFRVLRESFVVEKEIFLCWSAEEIFIHNSITIYTVKNFQSYSWSIYSLQYSNIPDDPFSSGI